MKKRFWALFLAVMMVVSVLPTSAFAVEVSDPFDPLQPAARYFQFDETEIEDAEKADITLSKTAEYKGKGTYKVTLSATAKEVIKPKPTKVVFVLDASSSMNACTETNCRHDKQTGTGCSVTDNNSNASAAFDKAESRWSIATDAIDEMKETLGQDGIEYLHVLFGNAGTVVDSYDEYPFKNSQPQYTRIILGVEAAFNALLAGRDALDPNTNYVMIIVSDGAATGGEYTTSALTNFKTQGGKVYAIGFTFSNDQFKGMATDDDHYMNAQDADDLEDVMETITENIVGLINDPMGSMVDLNEDSVDVLNDDLPEATTNGTTINWTDSEGLDGTVTLTYEVTIKPSEQKHGDLTVPLNGTAKLNYAYNGEDCSVDFPTPIAIIKAATLDVDYMLGDEQVDNDHEWINLTEGEEFETTVPEVGAEIKIDGVSYWVTAVSGEVPTNPAAKAYEVIVSLTNEKPIVKYTITYYDNVADETIEVPAPHTKQHNVPAYISEDFPVREGYEFLGWNTKPDGSGVKYVARAEYTENADLDLYAQWAINTYTVTYDWGTPADAVTEEYDLPVDENEYVPGEDYEVDDTEYAVIYVQDAYGNNNGKYTFSGWTDPNHGEMGNADVTITGEWEYEEITVTTYAVTYNWGTENIPTGVTLPVDSTAYVNNQPYEINDEYTSATVVYSYDAYGIANGKYTFSGWDKEDGVIAAENVEVTGSWTYAPYQPADLKILKEIASIGGKAVEYNEDGTVKTKAKVGDQIVWNIKIQNIGESATTVTVKDILKVGSEIIETAVWPNITIIIEPGVEEGDGVTLAGAMKYTVKDGDQGKSIVNTAVATDDKGKEKESDPTPGITVEKPELSITKTVNKTSAEIGDTLTYTIVVENKGNVDLNNVIVTDAWLNKSETIATLAKGESKTFIYTYKVVGADAGKTLKNTVIAKADNLPEEKGDTAETKIKKNDPVKPVGPSKPALNKADHYAYIVGYPDGLVHPEKNITRAEVSTIFFRMLLDESREDFWAQENWFSDVPAHMWFNNAVSTLANAGLITGYPDGSFKPNANITRAEFATIAIRFFLEEDVEITENNLSDVKGHWAEANINLAYALNLINGYPDGTFRPDQKITRAEAMTIVNRVLERAPEKDHLLDDMIEWPDNMNKDAWYYAAVQEATNSHEFYRDSKNEYEVWTELLPVRDWAALEREWSQANSSKNPGEVVDINVSTPEAGN